MRVLNVGCGRTNGYDARELFKYVGLNWSTDATVRHLDADAQLQPDVVCRLGDTPIPLPDDSIDLIIAWHVLEHVGKQGDTAAWFFAWEEMYRVLAPGGFIYGASPYYDSLWAWLDPSHARVIGEGSFSFVDQDSYRAPNTSISPYRVRCDFKPTALPGTMGAFLVLPGDPKDARIRNIVFSLRAVKPLRPWWEDGKA